MSNPIVLTDAEIKGVLQTRLWFKMLKMNIGYSMKWIAGGAAAGLVALMAACGSAENNVVAEVTVYKSPTCGCCKKWVRHLRDNGFKVTTHDVRDLRPIKAKHGVRPAIAACHTALVNGYVIEGHVPADVIKRLLIEKPRVAGIAVPGMPAGSPGMEGPRKERYHVLTFDTGGRTEVYARR